jgi:hypothetical protein
VGLFARLVISATSLILFSSALRIVSWGHPQANHARTQSTSGDAARQTCCRHLVGRARGTGGDCRQDVGSTLRNAAAPITVSIYAPMPRRFILA